MSDQGERSVRWTEMSESEPRDGADGTTGPQAAFPEPKVPEVPVPPPTGRTDFSAGEGAGTHDVWGKVETRRPEPAASEEPDPEDVKVAPVAEEAPQWEGSLFEEGDDDGGGDDKYVPAVPTGSGQPAKPGKPSSGNWQMPDWMADESAADAKLGGSPKPERDVLDGGGGRSRLVLFGGIGLLVVALLAAGGVYFMKSGDDEPADTSGNADRRAAAEQSEAAPVDMPPDKRLATFPGKPSRMLGRVNDVHSGLSYPRLAAPWQVPTKKNKLGTPGWSGQQILLTERHAGRYWYGQLLTGTLIPTLQSSYQGPDSVKTVAGLAAKGYEAQYYAFPHKTAPLASQALNVDGHKGWLVASYLTYKRSGVRATGEIVAMAVVDTGRKAPAVVFASMPNTNRKQWRDVNQFLGQLKIAS
ncbi:hypothetical protein BJY14_005524 [Actinomadura luteofluorescens]|uniref:Uncharacterized protein n=2 Tax=Actinomadura luteofluorescens TaxID=46163 RepID=A0A7Y9EKM7_9ACTN|nr:hypothetical protein [Actinomadura luteofluorescens]NYD49541.1 hypothetical protein [Actinomadura luteofluorescens]